MKKIAAIVIFYNPNQAEVLHNINTYAPYVDTLIIVDNSNESNSDIVDKLRLSSDIVYIPNNDNLGIATALNMGCDKAIELGFKWTLTMDQDSQFINFDFYKQSLLEIYDREDIALCAADNICVTHYKNSLSHFFDETYLEQNIHQHLIDLSIKCASNSYEETNFVITSSNFLNLALFNKIGRFEDKLFIDQVDFDYCAKCHINNYKIIKFNNIKFIHELGYYKDGVPQHNYIRKYYISRNMMYMTFKYGSLFSEYRKKDIFEYIRKNISHVWRKEEDRYRKVKYMLIGIMDFFLNKYGRKF